MPGSYADAQPRVWTPSFALPLLAACTGLSKANLCIVNSQRSRSKRKMCIRDSSRTAPVDEEGEQLLALAALEMHRHVACVHLESPERLHAHKRSFGRRSAFSRMGDLALQVLDGNWLEDVPVRMDPERVDGVIGIPRDEHDGASGAQFAHALGKLQPVGISQADIQEGDVRGSALEELSLIHI